MCVQIQYAIPRFGGGVAAVRGGAAEGGHTHTLFLSVSHSLFISLPLYLVVVDERGLESALELHVYESCVCSRMKRQTRNAG